jgi:hypothetical protein
MKASKNHNNIFGEKRLAHIRTIVVSLGGKLSDVLFYATTELHQQRYVMIFWVFILFCCGWPYFVVCGLCRTIRACGCLFLLFMRLFWLFVFSWLDMECVLQYWSSVDMSEYFNTGPLRAWVKNDDWCDPSSAGTLTRFKTIETCVESAFASVCVQSTIAGYFPLFWWGWCHTPFWERRNEASIRVPRMFKSHVRPTIWWTDTISR